MTENTATKNIEISLNFKTGERAVVLVPVNKSKYTSLQSKSCTYKQNLVAQVALGKISEEKACENWNKNVVKVWSDLAEPGYKASFPKAITDEVESIHPTSNLLDFDLNGVVRAEAAPTEVLAVEDDIETL